MGHATTKKHRESLEAPLGRRELIKAIGLSATAGAGIVSGTAKGASGTEVYFSVTELSPDSLVVEPGGNFDVTATVTNTGDESGTQQVTVGVAESEAAFDQIMSNAAGSADTGQNEVTITFNNKGQQAWRIINVDGADEADIVDGSENPTVSLEEGVRYTINNLGWIAHPLVFTDEDDNILLSQVHEGEFDGDPDVNWEQDDDVASFTLTPDLSDALAQYHCATHVEVMRGEIETGASSLLHEQTRTVTLEGGTSESLTFGEFETAGLETSEYVYGIVTENEMRTARLTVTPLKPYLNASNAVDTDGLREAIDDWRQGEISLDLLRNVIDAWRASEPIY
jgi:hypothetical protein